MGKIRYG